MFGPISKYLLYFVGLIAQAEGDVGDARAPQNLDLIEQKRSVDDRDNGLWRINGERTEPGAFAACEDECLHKNYKKRAKCERKETVLKNQNRRLKTRVKS